MGFPNAYRGLRIKGTDFIYHSEGAYGLVFVDKAEGRIRKLYKSTQRQNHRKKVFENEVKAYEIASNVSELKDLIPKYYGTRAGMVLIDKNDEDVTNEIDVDLAFEAEFIDGCFQKRNSPGVDQAAWDDIKEKFRKHGIRHVKDASVTLKNNSIEKVIDFSFMEIEPSWDQR